MAPSRFPPISARLQIAVLSAAHRSDWEEIYGEIEPDLDAESKPAVPSKLPDPRLDILILGATGAKVGLCALCVELSHRSLHVFLRRNSHDIWTRLFRQVLCPLSSLKPPCEPCPGARHHWDHGLHGRLAEVDIAKQRPRAVRLLPALGI